MGMGLVVGFSINWESARAVVGAGGRANGDARGVAKGMPLGTLR